MKARKKMAATDTTEVKLPERWLRPSVSGEGTADRGALFAELEELGLLPYAWQLDADGFTVVPPDPVAPPSFAGRLHAAVIRLVRDELGLQVEKGGELEPPTDPRGTAVSHAVCRDRVFEEAVLNRASLALLSYLLGASFKLSISSAVAKARSNLALPFHADNPPWQPDPWPPYAQVANATWLLSDYSRENGALCLVAGSHRLARRPTGEEAANFDNPNLVTVEAPAGSLAVWHGHTWHGAHPRTAPGARLSFTTLGARPYMQVQHNYRGLVTEEMLARNPDRFRILMGLGDPAPYGPRGPDAQTSNDGIVRAGRSLFA